MDPCSQCQTLTLARFAHYLQADASGARRKPEPILLFESGSGLQSSSTTCSLCKLFAIALRQELGRHCCNQEEQPSLLTGEIFLTPKIDSLELAFPEAPSPGFTLVAFTLTTAQKDGGKQLKCTIRLHTNSSGKVSAKDGKPNSINKPDPNSDAIARQAAIGARRRLSNPGSDEAIQLLRDWLTACHARHDVCKQSLSGSSLDESHPLALPPRVLDVRNAEIRLLDSAGMTGRYIALSYCWGPTERPPLKTTRDNVADHLREISWSALPRTFQDAVTVARRLDIPYVWIDSLCIVQDDHSDWLHQSEQMGSIYKHAELTLAASHAEDSWQGFLTPRSQGHASVELEGFAPSSNVKVMASIRSETADEVFPEHGILNNRAWATQEWLLSRRMVFYTPGQVMWSCKKITQRETGERCYSVSRNHHWKNVIEQYSDRNLTYPTDKLIALEGLRAESQPKYGHEYIHGVWKDCLPDQLLWHVTEKVKGNSSDDPLRLPTWSWAHVRCGVRFLPIHGAKNATTTIGVSDDGRKLSITASTQKLHSVVDHITGDQDGAVNRAIAADLESTHSALTTSMAKYAIDERGNTRGWILFDHWEEGVSKRGMHCLVVMGTLNKRDEDKERRTMQVRSGKMRQYWVIVVSEVADGLFQRVGVGKLYGMEVWRAASRTIVLV